MADHLGEAKALKHHLSITDWHERFRQQARWTEEARTFVFRQITGRARARILEVGCGTGVITRSLKNSRPSYQVTGIDIRFERISFARHMDDRSIYLAADGFHLPFDRSVFDATVCHFYLLWMDNPVAALLEMCRVTRSGAYVAALAEPDYGGRIDFPEEMAQIGRLQRSSLISQGADPDTGRKLAGLFHEAGLQDIHVHLMAGCWDAPCDRDDFELEWDIIRSDLDGVITADEMSRYYDIDLRACRRGTRIQFVPTFFAWGRIA